MPDRQEVHALLIGGPFDGSTATFSVDPDVESRDTLLLPDPKSQVNRLHVYERAGVADDGRWIYQFDATEHAKFGGMVEVACSTCGWSLPSGRYLDHGTRERPGCADYWDAARPLVMAHIDGTRHPVLVTFTTYHPDREAEQSTMRFQPRANH